MSIGQLRTRLHVEESVEVRTADGGVQEGWAQTQAVWGRVQGLRGRELFSAQQINPQLSHKVTIRYCKDLNSQHRLVAPDGSRILNIESVVDVDERHKTMELMCTEVPADG